FRIENLTPGEYNIDASRTLFVRARQSAAAIHLNLSSDQHLRDVQIQLMPTAVITGRIYDEAHQPLRGADVQAFRYQYRDGVRVLVTLNQASSNDRGDYRLYNLQPGAYYIRATPPTNTLQASLAPVYYPGVIDSRDAAPVTVTSGGEAAAIDISLTANP